MVKSPPPCSGCLLDGVQMITTLALLVSFTAYVLVHAVHFYSGSVSKAAEYAVLCLLFYLGDCEVAVMVSCCPSRSFQTLLGGV